MSLLNNFWLTAIGLLVLVQNPIIYAQVHFFRFSFLLLPNQFHELPGSNGFSSNQMCSKNDLFKKNNRSSKEKKGADLGLIGVIRQQPPVGRDLKFPIDGLCDFFAFFNRLGSQNFRWISNLAYNEFRLSWIECIDTKKDGFSKFVYVTDLDAESQNIFELSAAGRLQFKIENEGFNTLKNSGYGLEHKYSIRQPWPIAQGNRI